MSALRRWPPEALAASLALAMSLDGVEAANDNAHSHVEPSGERAGPEGAGRADSRDQLGEGGNSPSP